MDPSRTPHERAPPDPAAGQGEPPRSEALEAELAALEAILPAGSPADAPRPAAPTKGGGEEPAVAPPPEGPPATGV